MTSVILERTQAFILPSWGNMVQCRHKIAEGLEEKNRARLISYALKLSTWWPHITAQGHKDQRTWAPKRGLWTDNTMLSGKSEKQRWALSIKGYSSRHPVPNTYINSPQSLWLTRLSSLIVGLWISWEPHHLFLHPEIVSKPFLTCSTVSFASVSVIVHHLCTQRWCLCWWRWDWTRRPHPNPCHLSHHPVWVWTTVTGAGFSLDKSLKSQKEWCQQSVT